MSTVTGRRVIGIDLDNTLVSYDELFHVSAVERGLVARECAPTKASVRTALRAAGRESDWTELQGYVYGPAMKAAHPFPGALELIERCDTVGIDVMIVSHRTRVPCAGPPFDLHRAAFDWLEKHGVSCPVHLETTVEAKIERIAREGCSHFVDDLPEFLARVDRPPGIVKVLFVPDGELDATAPDAGFSRLTSWEKIEKLVMGDAWN